MARDWAAVSSMEGLLSEERETGRQLGNTPQAFSHFAVVMSALALHEGSVNRSDVPVRDPGTD